MRRRWCFSATGDARLALYFQSVGDGMRRAVSEAKEVIMKTKLLAVLLLAGGCALAAPRVVVGVGVGGYVAPAPVYAYAPPPVAPAAYVARYRPGYAWVGGYWYPYRGRYSWRRGYWARPPYAGAYWVGPRWNAHRYYPGYWRR
jgi:hypothetical protein